ncbi:hypothetical protein D3C87_1834360 [compost metagenome]
MTGIGTLTHLASGETFEIEVIAEKQTENGRFFALRDNHELLKVMMQRTKSRLDIPGKGTCLVVLREYNLAAETL